MSDEAVKTGPPEEPKSGDALLASGGGNATAAGVTFQGGLGALFAVMAMEQRILQPRLRLGNARPQAFRFETEAPVDDTLISTTANGYLSVQAKTALNLSSSLDSELGKTAEQIVKQWNLCETGDGDKGWNHPLSTDQDRFVIAVGPGASNTIATDLATALAGRREHATAEVIPKSQTDALEKFTGLLKAAWTKVYGSDPPDDAIARLLDIIVILQFDFDGADLLLGAEILRGSLAHPEVALAAFRTLAGLCEDYMKRRTGFDIPQIRRRLEESGIRLLAPPDYRADTEAFRGFSNRVQQTLAKFEVVKLDEEKSIAIFRKATTAAKNAAESGSLLLIGEPGAGKSGVINNLARQLGSAGYQVLQLAVDKAPVSGMDGLRSEIGLTHPVRSVLENCPGTGPAFLLIDGLDAARGGPSEAVYRNLISETLELPDQRWRVIASVRSFDLRLGQQFKTFFKGAPPDPAFEDASLDFRNVRHLQVRPWDNNELDELLLQAPKLKAAIEAGGKRLFDLALVPFNTQLLADLVAAGVEPSALGFVKNQTELLKMYWSHRVDALGSVASACLKSIVRTMVEDRSLRAKQDEILQSHAAALDKLLSMGVLVSQSNDRYVAFRHNILFDYAASRLYLDPYEPNQLKGLFARGRGLGLILSPALSYAMQELWDAEVDHRLFWARVVLLAGDKAIDPIARSMIARMSSELPKSVTDVEQLVAMLSDTTPSAAVFSAITGALAIRLEDAPHTADIAPWAHIIARLSQGAHFVSAISFLIERLLKHPGAATSLDQLGSAARNLLKRALDAEDPDASQNPASSIISYVAKTFASDPNASRALLQRIFEPARLAKAAHTDVPALAREIESIAGIDPQFAVSIYGAVFGYTVLSEDPTLLVQSQIMPMRSHASQDYEMSRFSLVQYYPKFLADNPQAGTEALIRALDGDIAVQHPLHEGQADHKLVIDGSNVRFTEDDSHVWAWEIESSHPDNTQALLQAFIQWFRKASPDDASTAMATILAGNRMALLWARLLMVAGERSEICAGRLWSFATNENVLLSSDTRKDAIDAIASFYPLRTLNERRNFEERALSFDFSNFRKAERARQLLLAALFQTIGQELLVTDEARAFLKSDATAEQVPNDRPFTITGGAFAVPPRQWLQDQGVDLERPVHDALLTVSDDVRGKIGLMSGPKTTIDDVPAAVLQLRALFDAIQMAKQDHADEQVVRSAEGVLGDGCTAILGGSAETTSISDVDLASITEMTLELSRAVFPVGSQEVEEQFARSPHWGGPAPRVDAVLNLLRLSRRLSPPGEQIMQRLESMISDPHPAVRCHIAENLALLWNHERDAMWTLAARITSDEQNPAVIAAFTSFLGRVRNADSGRVESMVLRIHERFPFAPPTSEKKSRNPLDENIAALVAMLYVWNNSIEAGKLVLAWAAAPKMHEEQIRSALFHVRQAMTAGYDSDTPEEQAARQRSHKLLEIVVDRTATGLEEFHKLDSGERQKKQSDGMAFAKCMDYACGSLFFVSGAFREPNVPNSSVIQSAAGKARFLADVQSILRRLGDVATPHTIYQLLQLLEFLLPAEPATCFDLVANAMTEGGRKQGYHLDLLGVDIFVRIIGRCLADHDYIFQDETRRNRLIACLDLFIEVGWPNALRLLYRIPEALR